MILPRKRKRETFLPLIQLALDALTVWGTLRLTFWARFESGHFPALLGRPDYSVYHRAFMLVTLTVVFFLRSQGLYKPARLITFANEAARVVRAILMTVVLIMAITFFIRSFSFSRTYFLFAGVVLALSLSLQRFGLGLLIMAVDRARSSLRNLLVINADEHARKIAVYFRKNPRFSTTVVGYLDDRVAVGSSIEGVPVLGRTAELTATLQKYPYIHEVVLSGRGHSTEQVLKSIYECEKSLVTFRWIADLFGLIASKMSVAYLAGVPLLSFVDSPLGDWENRTLKRAMDVLVSLGALLLLSPVFALIALWVRLDSRGPVIYRQERVGEDGRRFALFKFRTMLPNAEAATGPVWASQSDPRRTRLGGFLRRNNLDELPQLWNVLRGEMSLVGPRPERPVFVSRFREDIPRYMARHSIRSGITGWAQVNGLRGNTSIEERTKFDLFYIENWSLGLDLKILFMTLFARRNAY